MGAFYQTSSPQFIDFNYKPPMELMMKSIEAADQQNEAQDAQVALLEDTFAKLKTLEGDSPRTREIVAAYQDRVNEITAGINAAPQDWRKRMGEIRGLARQVSTDYTSGELAAQQENYSTAMERIKEERKRVLDGKVSPEFFDAFKAKMMDPNFRTAYEAKTGDYNRLNMPLLAEKINLNDRYDKYLKDVKASMIERKSTSGKGMYFRDTKQGLEQVSEEELRAIADQKFMADTEVQHYIKQGVELGVFKDPAALLLAAREGAVNTYGYSKSTQESTLRENPVETMLHGEAVAEDVRQRTWARDDKKDAAAAEAARQKEAREAQQKQHLEDMKNNQTPGMTPRDVTPSPYKGWSTGEGQTFQEVEYVPPAPGSPAGTAGTWKVPEGNANAGMTVPGIPGTLNSAGQLAGMGMPSGLTTTPIYLFTPEELQPDVLRTETLPNLYTAQVEYTKAYADAEARGDVKGMKDANSNLINTKSAIYTAEGILRKATDDYYASHNFAKWPAQVQQQISGYLTYLKQNNLADGPLNRKAYSEKVLGIPYEAGFGQGSLGVSRGLERFEQIVGVGAPTPARDLFDRAVNDAVGYLGDHATKDAGHNMYNAAGIAADLSDPTISGVLNTSFLGNVSFYGPNIAAGKTLGGKPREVGGLFSDSGIMPFGTQGDFSFAKLKAEAGVNNVTDLLEGATFLASTEGSIRVQVKLKKELANGDNVSNSQWSKHQIEGLSDDNTMIVEITDPVMVRQIQERFAKDKTPGVAKLSQIISNPDNANFMERIGNTVSPNEPGWGSVNHTTYGDITYKLQSNHDGRMEAKAQFEEGGKSYEATFMTSTKEAMQTKLTNFHNSMHNMDPKDEYNYRPNFISILKANGIIKER